MFWKRKKSNVDVTALTEQLAAETKQINDVEAKRSKAIDEAEKLADRINDAKD